jgi:rhodanese-related sulfurtransferase
MSLVMGLSIWAMHASAEPGCPASVANAAGTTAMVSKPARLSVFASAQQVRALLEEASQDAPRVVVIDVRSADEYAKGHLPGTVNLPPDLWRTPSAKPGQGYSQYLFLVNEDYEDGQLDVKRYERMLSDAGVDKQDTVVV